jgi:hypothetical protein
MVNNQKFSRRAFCRGALMSGSMLTWLTLGQTSVQAQDQEERVWLPLINQTESGILDEPGLEEFVNLGTADSETEEVFTDDAEIAAIELLNNRERALRAALSQLAYQEAPPGTPYAGQVQGGCMKYAS